MLHPFGRNPDWWNDNTETENLFISEYGRNEEAEVQDVIDEGDKLSYGFWLVSLTEHVERRDV